MFHFDTHLRDEVKNKSEKERLTLFQLGHVADGRFGTYAGTGESLQELVCLVFIRESKAVVGVLKMESC